MQHFANTASGRLPLETQTYYDPLKTDFCLFSYVVSKSFYFGEWKHTQKKKQPEKSPPNAVFVWRVKKCSHPLHQELNSGAAVTLYLLCTTACKLCYYLQVPYHSFWAISVSTETSYITLLNFGVKGQPESAREDYRKTETEWDLVCFESKYTAAQELPFHFISVKQEHEMQVCFSIMKSFHWCICSCLE